MKYTLLLASALMVFVSACNKQPDDVASAEDNLRSGTWRQTSGKFTYYDEIIGHDTTIDYWTGASACAKDNALQFKAGTDGTQLLGSDKCVPGEPDEQVFYWRLLNDEKRLLIYNAGESFLGSDDVNADIVTLMGNRLTLQYDMILTDPLVPSVDTVTVTNIYSR